MALCDLWRYSGDGGGRTFGIDYLPLFQDLGMPREPRVFEWCAGPGFTGFALLATVFARRFVSPTSTRKLSKPAGSPWRATDCQSGSPFIAQRIWMGSPDPNAGIWLLAIRRVMSALPPKADIGTGTRITFGAPAPAAWRYSPQFHCTRLSYVYHDFPMRARRGI